MTIGIQFPGGITPFGKAVLEKPENKQELIKQVSVACGKEMNIKFLMFSFFLFLYHRKKFTIDRD
jgi:hypothetical protein